jgi:hypothetical protein
MWSRFQGFLRHRSHRNRYETLQEFYEAVNDLSTWLKREGHVEDASKLDDLMHTAWTTGSELIGELRLALQNMKGRYSPELMNEINECREFAQQHRKILGLS